VSRKNRYFALLLAVVLSAAATLLGARPSVAARRQPDHPAVRLVEPRPGPVQNARPARLAGHAIVNFERLSKIPGGTGDVRPLAGEDILEDPAEPGGAPSPGFESPTTSFAASPGPSSSFMGLDDIPMVDSLYIIIPPDVGGAVGLTRILSGHNNNYRIFEKTDGSVVNTVGTATFWAPSGETALNALTDPRTLYDPYNDRYIAVMQSFVAGNSDILVGVSQTSDPNGNWYLYRFPAGVTLDFPNVGFNKNWIVVSINRYSNGGLFQRGITLIVDYPQARAGTGSGVIVTQQANTHYCTSPCVTYSATEDTLFLITHLSSGSATYAIDTITGTPGSPTYTAGGTQTRPGGGWAQPGGQILPQAGPVSGTSTCSPPCPIESQDSQVRSAPVYRNGSFYYSQTIGLPSTGYTHTSVQWTRLSMPGGAFLDGGRIDDAAATSTNGGKWYAYPEIAVNSVGDFMIGYSQFSSVQHPAAGYSMHLAGDAAGTIRDPVIYKPGEDYYHKDFGSGRNRWGDFSQAQVDPSDDRSLWSLQEYGKARASTNDGTTGSNGSRWSTWWANVAGPAPTVTLAPGPSQNEGNSGLTPFVFRVDLSTGYSLPVTVDYQTSDGTATVADNDYQAASGSLTIPAGITSDSITVYVVGDVKFEGDETFNLTLTGVTNGVLGTPATATATILNDDTGNFTITASAGPNGSIAPSGAVSVPSGADQSFTISANSCYHVADVLVDGGSVGAQTSYTFPAVSANHTISASFALDTLRIVASAGPGGSISPLDTVRVACGSDQTFTITPDATHAIADVLVDGSSVGAVGTYTFPGVATDHTIAASFVRTGWTITASAGTGGAIAPSGAVVVATGADQTFTITPDACYHIQDVLVDGGSVGAQTSYTFPGVSADHTISASFTPDLTLSIGQVVQYEGNSGTTPFDFPVTLSGTCSATVQATWKTVDGTATAASGDYVPDSTVVSFPPGTTSQTVTVLVNGDLTPEDTETFTVELSDPVGAGIATAQGIGTILNDDGVTAADASVVHELSFSVESSIPVSGEVTFRIGIPAPVSVDLAIFDVRGRRVAEPVSGVLPAGYRTAHWGARSAGLRMGSGVYFARFIAGGKTFTRRFVILR
jgi:hypothetical protein